MATTLPTTPATWTHGSTRSASTIGQNGRETCSRPFADRARARSSSWRNFFVEDVLPHSVKRTLTGEEFDAYRASFAKRADRLPILVWPREIPIDGTPSDVVQRVEAYDEWLASSSSKRTMDRPSASPSPPGGRVEDWSAKRHERSARETPEPECTVPVADRDPNRPGDLSAAGESVYLSDIVAAA